MTVYTFFRSKWGGLGGLVRHFPRQGLVVDLGAGEGILARRLAVASPGIKVIAVDAHEPRIRRLRATGLPIEAVCARIEAYAIPRCDAVALVDVLHYFEGAVQESILDRAVAALAPGGTLVIRDPDAGASLRFRWNSLHERIFLALGWTVGARGLYRTGDAWARLLAARGLSVVTEPIGRWPYADRVVVGRKP